jgi:tetratricopeptide (TPR) repeat protein
MLARGHADSAAAAYYWASRLDPTRAYPYYARSIALLLTYGRQETGFAGGTVWARVADVPPARLVVIDSLHFEALSRDPFLPQRLDHLLTGRPPNGAILRLRDPAARGYWAYAVGAFGDADSLLGVALRARPGRATLREIRARAEYALGRYDSAAVQLRVLLDTLSHRDSSALRPAYSSKEMIYYALGQTHAQRGDTAAARIAFESAIGENAAFYPAHTRIAALASARGDVATAIRELAAATEIAPSDPSVRYFYGVALLEGGAPGPALVQLLRAIDLDPWYAKPYLFVGRAYERRGDLACAAEAYAEYAERESVHAAERAWARARADSLRPGGAP